MCSQGKGNSAMILLLMWTDSRSAPCRGRCCFTQEKGGLPIFAERRSDTDVNGFKGLEKGKDFSLQYPVLSIREEVWCLMGRLDGWEGRAGKDRRVEIVLFEWWRQKRSGFSGNTETHQSVTYVLLGDSAAETASPSVVFFRVAVLLQWSFWERLEC